uniref:P-type ATPase C-terminal domain-containing protein n=1 Tax=Mycena chlorophos TaxID=658473 RepID=A0ABQ0MDK4_MYCCL|nr:predicted protein [Mycena chlorophos]
MSDLRTLHAFDSLGTAAKKRAAAISFCVLWSPSRRGHILPLPYIVLTNIVPISFYITIEFLRSCQALCMYFDSKIYYEKKDGLADVGATPWPSASARSGASATPAQATSPRYLPPSQAPAPTAHRRAGPLSNGLRTLTVAYKEVFQVDEYNTWNQRYHDSMVTLDEQALEDVSDEIDDDLRLLSATAIEDHLQDGVPETTADLQRAGIKVWVATGDKLETTIAIGNNTNHIRNTSNIIIIRNGDEVPLARVNTYVSSITGADKGERPDGFVLVISLALLWVTVFKYNYLPWWNNTFWTIAPLITMGIFERFIDAYTLIVLSELYRYGRERRWFGFNLFSVFMLGGVHQFAIIIFICEFATTMTPILCASLINGLDDANFWTAWVFLFLGIILSWGYTAIYSIISPGWISTPIYGSSGYY